MSTISLTDSYGTTPYKVSGLASGTVIDAETASWIQSNSGSGSNDYPFQVYESPNAVLDGGTINGQIDQTSEWRTVYNDGNSAAIRTEDTPNVVIRDWRITDTWDAVRVSWNSQNFLIEDVWVTNARDDAVENDRLQTGTIRDSLFDGVFGGISIDPSSSSPVDGSDQTVTIDGVLMRMQSFLYEGEMTHSAMIKTDSATNGAVTPNLVFTNNVFAIEDVNHHSYRSMFDAWDHTTTSSNNFLLNLSDTPLPDDYPMPPEGWTVIQGQAARDYWDQAKAEWINNHEGDGGTTAPPPVESVSTDTPTVPDATTASGSDTTGTTTGSSPSTDGTSTSTVGTTAGGTTTDGVIADGTTTDGATAGGTTTDGVTTDGTTTDGATAGGTTTDGVTTGGTTTDGATAGGTTTDGTTTGGTTTSNSPDPTSGGQHWWQQAPGHSKPSGASGSPDSTSGGKQGWQLATATSTTSDTSSSSDSTSGGLGHHWQQASATAMPSAPGGDWHQHYAEHFW